MKQNTTTLPSKEAIEGIKKFHHLMIDLLNTPQSSRELIRDKTKAFQDNIEEFRGKNLRIDLLNITIDDKSPLQITVDRDNLYLARFLIRNGANTKDINAPTEMMPLLTTARNIKTKVVPRLCLAIEKEDEGKFEECLKKYLKPVMNGIQQGINHYANLEDMIEGYDKNGNNAYQLLQKSNNPKFTAFFSVLDEILSSQRLAVIDPTEAFVEAIKNDDQDRLNALIRSYKESNTKNTEEEKDHIMQRVVLEASLRADNTHMAGLSLDAQIDCNNPKLDQKEWRRLYGMAIKFDNVDMIELILTKRIKHEKMHWFDPTNNPKLDAIHDHKMENSLRNLKVSDIESALDEEVNEEEFHNQLKLGIIDHNTLCHQAVMYNAVKVIEHLMKFVEEQSPKVMLRDINDADPLLLSANLAHVETTQFFITTYSSDIADTRNKLGNTPLHEACLGESSSQNRVETVRLLLDCNNNSQATNKAGETALDVLGHNTSLGDIHDSNSICCQIKGLLEGAMKSQESLENRDISEDQSTPENKPTLWDKVREHNKKKAQLKQVSDQKEH